MVDQLTEQLEAWLKKIESISTNISIDDQARITKAGADVFDEKLSEYTKSKHYRHRKTGEDPHLADSVMADDTNVDGQKDGSSLVGFDDWHAHIARFINDGTKQVIYNSGHDTRHDKNGRSYRRGGRRAVNGDHFVDDARKLFYPDVLKAENAEYRKIMKEKGLDNL
ncbi:HK97 gp10 family phage protein [Oenococcus sicerae]|uniref:HK97 gp10 family phage protein n=1 Tax=Oenococcus sicerae TaxID=2203724 RepID=UPI0039E8D9B6